MSLGYFALTLGAVYGIVGLVGFIPGIVTPPAGAAPDLAVDAGYGLLLGLFPVNVLHNLVHLAVGLWGIASYRSFGASKLFAQAVAVIFGVLAVMGVIPVLNTTFGLIPLFGHDIWLHTLTAAAGAYFGFAAPDGDRVYDQVN